MKDVRKWIRVAERAGWSVQYTGGKHLKWTPPAGPFIISGTTQSEPRGFHNLRSRLRKAGLDI